MTRENTELAGAIERLEGCASDDELHWALTDRGEPCVDVPVSDLRIILSALSAAPLHEGEGEPSREEVARIIDPAAFMFGPGELDDKVYSASRAHAIDRADRILKLIASARSAPPPSVEVERLREALTPSGDTKAAYSGEFKFQVTQWRENEDPDAEEEMEEYLADFTVPWTTIKEVMAAIAARAALSRKQEPGVPTPGGEG